MNARFAACGVAALLCASRSPASGASATDFDWRDKMSPGTTLVVSGIVGDIRAVAADGATATVRARRSSPSGNPSEVRIQVKRLGDRVAICAVYPGDQVSDDCSNHYHPSSESGRDIRVDFDIALPRRVALKARTVNGKIVAKALASNVDADTVSEGIDISTSGYARAHSVNGPIEAVLGDAAWSGSLRFSTVNGQIHVALPRGANFTVRARTLNGAIDSDGFPIGAGPRDWFGPSINATVGGGGRSLDLETVNGSVRLSAI